MRLYEYEAKRLIADAGVPCPHETLIENPDEASHVLTELEYPVVLKAQVLTGGRGKAGGIQFANTPDEAIKKTKELFAARVRGFAVHAVLVAPRLNIASEYYLGVTIDRTIYKQTVMVSAAGGIDIEKAADSESGQVIRCDLDPDQRFHAFLAVSLAKAVGLSGDNLKRFVAIVRAVVATYRKYDAKLLEINPLVVTEEGDMLAADARMSVDDDALFRQKALAGLDLTSRHEEGALTDRERQAKEWGIPYLDLDGNIGMFPGGAGYGIMGNDFIVRYGGKPANFMDSGGGPSPERIARMLVLLDDNPQVETIFGARFGGISRCDDFARGVIKFLREHGLSKPLVMRMTGNMWQEGLALFEEARTESPDLFANVKIYGIETPIERVVEEAVNVARGGEA